MIWGYNSVHIRKYNAKVLYRSGKRMAPGTAPTKRLQKVGRSSVLADWHMRILNGKIPENTTGVKG